MFTLSRNSKNLSLLIFNGNEGEVILDKIEKLDRRFIFIFILIAVIIPLLVPFGFDVGITKPVQSIYDFVEKLPDGSVIWMGFDYHNSTRTECDSQAIAFLHHAFRKKHKVFITSMVADGNNISRSVVHNVARQHNRVYGKDYVILGYKPGFSVVMIQVCQNLRGIYNTDVQGTPIEDLPMMKNIRNHKDIDMLFTATDNQSFDYYVQIASTQYHVPMAGGSTAVSVPKLYIYINSGQALGVLGGLKGAAEYEKLIDKKGMATAGMDAQSFVHVLIVILILFSNAVYFVNKYRNPAQI